MSGTERLNRFFDRFSQNDHVLIPISADPDAIACAMAVKRLLWRRVAGVTLAYINIIERPDNLAMIRLLGVPLVHIDHVVWEVFSRIVLVDSQPNHNEIFSKIKPDAIIDHHPETGVQAPFMDIRPKYGATATILTEYLRAAKIKPSAKLATALFLAIKTDTNGFERQATIEDVRAFQFLFKHANIYLARKIERAILKLEFLKYFKTAFENRRMRRGKIFVHLDQVVNPDICVIIADFFMRVDTATWSIVSGFWQDKLIIILRNDGLRKDAGKVAKKSFAREGSAGGHKSMARAEISLSDLKPSFDPKNEKKVMEWIINRIEKGSEMI
ncbi:MAG: phosphoesterase [Deltaproteobacteria bacterium RBG_13_49_15]|nr:MAG: phosphoesterase [Deltaproteobacteria bacterium RBG_13_49_15]